MYGTQNFKKGGITDGKISPCSDVFEKKASIKYSSDKKSKPKVVQTDGSDKKSFKFELRISHEYSEAPLMKKRGSKSLVTRTHSQLSQIMDFSDERSKSRK